MPRPVRPSRAPIARVPPHEVVRRWPGQTVVCAACGPSLTQADLESVRGRAPVVVVNNAYTLAPWADILYAADHQWWRWHYGVKSFAGARYSLSQGAKEYGVTVLKKGRSYGLSLDPTTLCTGMNSGYQAINLAVLSGATRIVLLGYDLCRGPKGEQHFFGDHPNRNRSNLVRFAEKFDTLVKPLAAAGVTVVNCSRRTALTCFPTAPLEEVFPVPDARMSIIDEFHAHKDRGVIDVLDAHARAPGALRQTIAVTVEGR